MSWKLSPGLASQISHYAQFPATGVSLRQMVQFGQQPSAGTLFRASQFIVEELPIRLAHRVQELEDLPDGLNEMPSINKVKDWYSQSFEELTTIPTPKVSKELRSLLFKKEKERFSPPPLVKPNSGFRINSTGSGSSKGKNMATTTGAIESDDPFYMLNTKNPSLDEWHFYTSDNCHNRTINSRRYYANVAENAIWPPEVYNYNRILTERLQKIKRRHDATVATVAQGVNEWKQRYRRSTIDPSCQSFLDRFYMSRIGIRMLIGQHIAMNVEPARDNYVGIICTDTNVREIARDAIDNASFICEQYYDLDESPKVELVCSNDIKFMYVPGHLLHMIFEVLKNSLRAVVEKYGARADSYPSVKVIIAEGQEDITIKISDEGGGIPRSEIPLVWTYLYTTVESTPDLEPGFSKSDFRAPMAGLGYGLPLSRLYARYFGGDLRLISMEGYGTDVYLHLNRLSSSSEPLQ